MLIRLAYFNEILRLKTLIRFNLPLVVCAIWSLVVLSDSHVLAQAPFDLQGPGVTSSDFRITTFASGLNYPVGMTSLQDGSVLVATSNGGSFFGSSSGSLIRLADTNGDGVADVQQTLVNNVPGGKLSSLKRSGDLIFVTGQGSAPISVYRVGAQPSDLLSAVGSISIQYPGSWQHPHSALAVRQTPGSSQSHDLFFQVGSKTNFSDTTETVALSSTIGSSGQLAGDAVHMLRITDQAGTISGANPIQIATGLRNAAGMAFHPVSGDLYLQDNGIDGLTDVTEPTSADELNVIAAADIGGAVENFGFPTTYVEYRTDSTVGTTGIDPLVVFQPTPSPNGKESEGPNDIVFAPVNFPAAVNDGMFIGFHGQFSLAGASNEENPLVFVNPDDKSYFHFISTEESGIGHLDGLLATDNSLFVADLSVGGSLGSSGRNGGAIYQITAVPEPSAVPLIGFALAGMLYRRR